MVRFLRWVALPASAAAAILFAFLALACGFVQLEMYVAAVLKCGPCQTAEPAVFMVFLFVFATGIVPCYALKKIGVRNIAVHLSVGVISAVLAEYCYLFENDVWYTWDFSVRPYLEILAGAFQQVPSLFYSMIDMQPFTSIPLGVGILFSGLFWLFAARKRKREVTVPQSIWTRYDVNR